MMVKYYKEISHLLALGEEHFEEELRKIIRVSLIPHFVIYLVILSVFSIWHRL